MLLMTFALFLLATSTDGAVENPRFVSPNGEMCVVIRRYPFIGDFESIGNDEFLRRLEANGAFLEPRPGDSQPEPERGAIFRTWPSGLHELLGEFTCESNDRCADVLVSDVGHVVTHGAMRCGKDAELLTIRAGNGSLVRTIRVGDVLTANDQQWLCRGAGDDVRFTVGDTLRMSAHSAGRGSFLPGDTRAVTAEGSGNQCARERT